MAIDNKNAQNTASGAEVLAPAEQTTPVVFASPHSGRRYPADFVRQSRLGPLDLRRSEDAFIDEIFSPATEFGAVLLRAHFPRAYIDANRQPWELDPLMFADDLPDFVITKSPRIAAGLGTIPKIVASGQPIYNQKLFFDDASRRMKKHYLPYHQALQALVSTTTEKFGGCLLVDCHSMPSSGNGPANRLGDIVIGDLQGKTCHRDIVDLTITTLRNAGYSVALNKPYAGGYTTRHYGQPESGIHALQIEINRTLYMNEKHITRAHGLKKLKTDMRQLVGILTAIDPARLAPPCQPLSKAAE